jgi:hypothetical protein
MKSKLESLNRNEPELSTRCKPKPLMRHKLDLHTNEARSNTTSIVLEIFKYFKVFTTEFVTLFKVHI